MTVSVILPERPLLSIEDYVATGGGVGLRTARQFGPDGTIEEVTAAGLRGRGGGGFPTGSKWRSIASAGGGRHYVVANGAEGEPATFKDRALMRLDPFRVVEGAAIAALAVGAEEIYLATKASFVTEATQLRHAAAELSRAGLLDGLTVRVRRGTRRVPVRRGEGAARGHRGARPAAPRAPPLAARAVRHHPDRVGVGDARVPARIR